MVQAKKMTLGEARAERELSIEELAKMSGVPFSTVQAIESGRMSGSLIVKLKIADALGRSLRELWPETFEEMAELEELQKKDRKRARFITTNDLGPDNKLTPEARKRRIIEGD